MLCDPLPAIEGWSLSKRADADWESMEDWVARAEKDEVVSWYLWFGESETRLGTRLRGREEDWHGQAKGFLVQAVSFPDVVESAFLEGGFDPMQDVEGMVVFRPEDSV